MPIMNQNHLSPDDSWLGALLDQLVTIHQQNYRGADFSIMHLLAQYGYVPAKPILVGYLSDESDAWRYESLMALGFYYDLADDPDAMKKIRMISLHDPDEQIRACAIGVWATQRRVLDRHLLTVLEHDPMRSVRESALGNILMCYRHVVRGKYHGMMERAKTGKNKDWLTEKGMKKLFDQLGIVWDVQQ